ncbi:uncharacterized protein EDB91DRAFT_1351877, partial [Suillus paluster]|uniref:uncharacterized protein n=1 Tax=Suillus paluster TaxID=48578 RepID=UPI001B877365
AVFSPIAPTLIGFSDIFGILKIILHAIGVGAGCSLVLTPKKILRGFCPFNPRVIKDGFIEVLDNVLQYELIWCSILLPSCQR